MVVLEVWGRHHAHRYPGFFFHLTHHCLHRILVRLDVAAGRKPHAQFRMPVQQGRAVLNDEPRGGEMSDEGHRRVYGPYSGAFHEASWTLANSLSATSRM